MMTETGQTNIKKTVLRIDGIHVDSMARTYVVVIESIQEQQPTDSWPQWREISSRKVLADYGSQMVDEAMAGAPAHWLRGFFERFSRVVAANSDYILGAEAVREIEDTADDRRLATAIAHGAKMDPTTGILHGFDEEF